MSDKETIFKSFSSSGDFAVKSDFKGGFFDAIKVKKTPIHSTIAPKFEPEVVGKQDVVKSEEKKEEVAKISAQELDKKRLEGYEDGYAKGFNAAKSKEFEITEQINQNLNKILQTIENDKVNYEQYLQKQSKDLALIAINIAKKISGDVVDKLPLAKIEKNLLEILKLLFDEPVIMVNVNNELVGDLIQKMQNFKEKSAFAGQINFKGCSNIKKGDCQIEWKNGGLTISQDEIWQEINKVYRDVFNDN